MVKSVYKRIVIKLSGEALQGNRMHGVDQLVLFSIARQIKEIRDLKIDVAIVLGGGNIFRGQENIASKGLDMDRSVADYMGMLATVINGLALQDVLEKTGMPTRVLTAIEMQSMYVTELRKQMGVLLLIFGVVSFSVVVLVFCIFYMIVTTKRKDIAIMKSCGSSSGSVAAIFVGFGVCVGVIGSAVGVVLGDIITRNVNTIEDWIRIVFGLKLWRSSVYMFSRIPNEVDWNSAATIVAFAVAAAAVGTLIPAVVAARTKPVEILRYE